MVLSKIELWEGDSRYVYRASLWENVTYGLLLKLIEWINCILTPVINCQNYLYGMYDLGMYKLNQNFICPINYDKNMLPYLYRKIM